MPRVLYCLKCSTAKYKHSQWCRNHTTKVYYYNSLGAPCSPEDPDARKTIHKAHKLVDLNRKPYCSWERDYSRLKRVYARRYNPAGWYDVGWYCNRCGNFIENN